MFLLLFLPSLIYANHADLFNQYLRAIVTFDEPLLLKILHENFTIFDCNGAKITDRNSMISEFQKFPDEVLFELKTFDYLENLEELLSFKVDVAYEMINTYQVSQVNGSFVLLSENQSKCRNEYESWYTSSLIDYEVLFKSTANELVLEYCDVLDGNRKLETILDPSFIMTTCNNNTINLPEYSKQLLKLQERVVTSDCFEKSIDNVRFDKNGRLEFEWANNPIYEASPKNGKYLITSEILKNCENSEKFLSYLIDDYHTAMNIAENLSMDYYENFKNRTLKNVITEPVNWIVCKKRTQISLDELMRRIVMDPSEVPKYPDDVVLFTLRYDFWEGNMKYFLYPGRRYPRIIFNVDLNKGMVKLSVNTTEKCE